MPELIDTFLVTLFAMAVIIGLAPVALVLYGSTRWSEVSLAFNRARRIRLTDIFDQASRHGEIPQARTLNIVQRYFDIDDDIAWAKEVLKPKKDEFDESDFILARKMVDAVLQSTLNDPDQSREGSEDAVKGAIPPVRRHRRPHRSTGSNSAREPTPQPRPRRVRYRKSHEEEFVVSVAPEILQIIYRTQSLATLGDVRELSKTFAWRRWRLFVGLRHDPLLRRGVSRLGGRLLDYVGRGTAAGLFIAAFVSFSNNFDDSLLDIAAVLALTGGALGCVIHTAFVLGAAKPVARRPEIIRPWLMAFGLPLGCAILLTLGNVVQLLLTKAL